MTQDYTSLLNIALSSKTVLNNNSVNSNINVNSDAFSSVFDNVSKTYVDKSANKVDFKSNNQQYAQKTKDTKSAHKNAVVDNSKHQKTNNDIKKENFNKIHSKETQTDKNNSIDKSTSQVKANSSKQEKSLNSASENKATENIDNNIEQKTETNISDNSQVKTSNTENNVVEKTETLENVAVEELVDNSLTTAIVEDLDASLAKIISETLNNQEIVASNQDINVSQVVENVSSDVEISLEDDKMASTKNIVNEKMLANIEYTDTTVIEESLKLVMPELDKDILEQVIQKAKSAIQAGESVKLQDVLANISQDVQDLSQKLNLENLSLKTDDTAKLVQNVNSQALELNTKEQVLANQLQEQAKNVQAQETIGLKTAKENLAADTSRLTANIEMPVEDLEPVSVITPADTATETEEVPKIKVTTEVAASIRENTSANLENKDTASKIKDKAVAQMTDLQDTETVVTQSKFENSQNNSNLSQNNAQEQVVKLSVDQGSVSMNQSVTAGETFVSKLDAQFAAAKNTATLQQPLNKADILSQVNAKFEQLQQVGNNKVSIILQPENLGKVTVEIVNSNEGIVAKMVTDSQQVKDLFDKNIESLKSTLSSQGVNVNNIKVECSQESSNNAMNFERDQFNQSFNQSQSQNQNQANHSDSTNPEYYGTESGEYDETDTEIPVNTEISQTEITIKHNGKIDYSV